MGCFGIGKKKANAACQTRPYTDYQERIYDLRQKVLAAEVDAKRLLEEKQAKSLECKRTQVELGQSKVANRKLGSKIYGLEDELNGLRDLEQNGAMERENLQNELTAERLKVSVLAEKYRNALTKIEERKRSNGTLVENIQQIEAKQRSRVKELVSQHQHQLESEKRKFREKFSTQEQILKIETDSRDAELSSLRSEYKKLGEMYEEVATAHSKDLDEVDKLKRELREKSAALDFSEGQVAKLSRALKEREEAYTTLMKVHTTTERRVLTQEAERWAQLQDSLELKDLEILRMSQRVLALEGAAERKAVVPDVGGAISAYYMNQFKYFNKF